MKLTHHQLRTAVAAGVGIAAMAPVAHALSRKSGVVLEWERHMFRFVGGLKDDVDATTLGYVRRF
jgi:hypothetical protein